MSRKHYVEWKKQSQNVMYCIIPHIFYLEIIKKENRLTFTRGLVRWGWGQYKRLARGHLSVMGLLCIQVMVMVTQTHTWDISMSKAGNVTRFSFKYQFHGLYYVHTDYSVIWNYVIIILGWWRRESVRVWHEVRCIRTFYPHLPLWEVSDNA